MGVELLLEGLLVLLAIGTVSCGLGAEGDGGARGAGGFDGNVSKPFCDANGWLFHLTSAAGFGLWVFGVLIYVFG